MAQVSFTSQHSRRSLVFREDENPEVTPYEAAQILERIPDMNTCQGCTFTFGPANKDTTLSFADLQNRAALFRRTLPRLESSLRETVFRFQSQQPLGGKGILLKTQSGRFPQGTYVLMDSKGRIYARQKRIDHPEAITLLYPSYTLPVEGHLTIRYYPLAEPIRWGRLEGQKLGDVMIGGTHPLAHVSKWIGFYGTHLPENIWQETDMIIAEPRALRIPPGGTPTTQVRVGYLSLGEINNSMPYWGIIKDEQWVLAENPRWPGAHRIDVRSPEWHSLVLNEMIPAIIAKGYRGLFLDTIDVGPYFESRGRPGSRAAMISLIRQIRQHYPDLVLISNNGFEMLDDMAPYIDGALAEDVYTRYDSQARTYGRTPGRYSRGRERALTDFQNRYGKPVFILNYAGSSDQGLERFAMDRCREKGFRCYTTDGALKSFP